MPRPSRSAQIDAALLDNVAAHPQDLAKIVIAQLGLTRAAVTARIKELVKDGWLSKEGTTRPTYRLGRNRRGTFQYDIAGLREDQVWTRDVAPLLEELPSNIFAILQYGITEMVNNAIDHSEGSKVSVRIERTDDYIAVEIKDDGEGIFRKITRALDLPNERLALLELSKGKLTTDPSRHSGEGVFFTSRMFNLFQIRSGTLTFSHFVLDPKDALYDDEDLPGTTIYMDIAVRTKRTMQEVFAEYSSGPDDYAFAKTVVPVRLAQLGDDNLISRSQAKRLLQRVERFRIVEFDFQGVAMIGQAFADEIFRVFALEHPEVELVPRNAAPVVQQMIRRAEVLRDENAQYLAPLQGNQ